LFADVGQGNFTNDDSDEGRLGPASQKFSKGSQPEDKLEDSTFNSDLIKDTAMQDIREILIAIENISNERIKNKVVSTIKDPLDNLGQYAQGNQTSVVTSPSLTKMLATLIAVSKNDPQVKTILYSVSELANKISHPDAGALSSALGAADSVVSNEKGASTKIVKPAPVSGFLEFSPEIQLHLDGILSKIKSIFASNGYVPIDTPVVERLEILSAKGEIDKEIYTIGRVHSKGDDASDADLALRYDLTVPFARYVARHDNELTYPFKRYHIGDCWRGERPQDGRYRQFKQADIDVINHNNLPLSFDADIPLIVNEGIKALGVSDYVFRVSNRKILGGYLSGLGIENAKEVTRIIDKLGKVDRNGVIELLVKDAGLSKSTAEKAMKIAEIQSEDTSFVEQVHALGVENDQLELGVKELLYVMQRLNNSGEKVFLADLSITRGFDYYTGSVYEVKWNKFPSIGSIAAGGRYDDLASSYIRKKLPGVGMSIGISRIFGKLVDENLISLKRKTSTDVLIVWDQKDEESSIHETAVSLRNNGLNVEVYYSPDELSKQFRYADKKGIPFVLLPLIGQVKDMQTQTQTAFVMDDFINSLKNAAGKND